MLAIENPFLKAYDIRMRSALALLLMTTAAFASPEDDFAACLIGKASVALHNQAKKDPDAAMKVANDECQMPADIDGDQLEGIGEHLNAVIQTLAKDLYGT